MSTMKYRIVTDNYCGFEAQQRPAWWPFWSEISINTFSTVEAAEQYINKVAFRVVKYVTPKNPKNPTP